ncbi:IclR family transcriptional regulator [Williamsia sp. CHRR-6]|uniref:IclR family transcriptional regulator n=1 Tax=Williamsia sp. CHRR-6 TaxID=2835871 RepID=UPI001BD9C616|nr:IclR family transcriptional regulator [Williamsia sp. CHRR-6]MBT0566536.1 IclR family transcriptional regulator [Williamsia sp. CHRR-6]
MPGLIQSVERATAVMHLLAARDEPMTLAEIAAAVGVVKSTAHGLVRTLVAGGMLDQDADTGRYRLADDPFGPRRNLWDVNEIRSRALNWTDALASRSTLATQVTVVRGGVVRVVHDVLATRGAGARPLMTGATVPAHAGALGRVHLAYDAHLARSVSRSPLAAHTHRTIVDAGVLAGELARVRDTGWAVAIGDLVHDQATVAAPIRDAGGTVMAAVGVMGAVDDICGRGEMPRTALVDNVIAAARSISRELGHGLAVPGGNR